MGYIDIIMRTSSFLSSKPDAQGSLYYTICDRCVDVGSGKGGMEGGGGRLFQRYDTC